MPLQLKLAEKHPLHRNSPSLLYNNLHALGGNEILYVSGNNVFRSDSNKKKLSNIASYPEPVIYCFAASLPQCGDVVVVLNQLSADLFVSNKSCVSLVYEKYSLTKGVGLGKCVTFCADKSGTVWLFIGTSTGDLISSDFNPVDIGDSITYLKPKGCTNTHKLHSITALDASYDHFFCPVRVASGDIGGNVVLWDKDMQPYFFITSCNSESECVTAVKICGEGRLAAVTFGNGKLILYSTITGSKSVEICAHSRWINAIACFHGSNYQGEGDLIATASEDGTVQLYKIVHSDGEVTALVQWMANIELSNVLPTGLCFEENGRSLALSCYDTPSISVYTLSDL